MTTMVIKAWSATKKIKELVSELAFMKGLDVLPLLLNTLRLLAKISMT